MILRNSLLLLSAIAAAVLADVSQIQSEAAKSSQNDTSKLITERVDINKTVSEVEKILEKYPELPRIERSEILSILQNITEADNEKLKEELTGVLEEETQKMQKESSKEQGEPIKSNKTKQETRPQGSRSVMVVLPFKPEEQEDSLEELFTKSPMTIMEEQKDEPDFTTRQPVLPEIITGKGYSIIEKEDKKFNPPLRVIGFRYHTTAKPKSEETSKSYQNFLNPEQVTMAFRTQETKANGWNHKEVDFTSTTQKLETNWGEKAAQAQPVFHVPDTMDNFSIEDAISGESLEESFTLKTIHKNVETTTEKVFITTAKPIKSTERIPKTTRAPVKKKYKTKATTTSTTIAPTEKHKKVVLDNLPPHMKDMLSDIGIDDDTSFMENTESPQVFPIQTANANIDASSYQFFKPLPIKKQKLITDDMQQFLASFGLLDTNRHQKAMTESTTVKFDDKFLESAPTINTDFLTDDMKKTLSNLGLYDSPPPKKTLKKHIFNPKNVSAAQTEEEVRKLNALLGTIKKLASLNESDPVTPEFQKEILNQVKELDNITISYKTSEAINEEIHKIMAKNKGKFKIPVVMKESNAFKTLKPGLDPEFFEDIQLKNEVKRQENSSSTEESKNDDSTTEGSSSSTTEPANSAALEDAFGGGDTAPAGSNPADSLPPKRPNGLYLLLDWNTFFEVGTEDDSRRVNIRFQPKIGDGRNFLPVTIP